jgi:YD repeat-containing protein
LSTCPVTTYGYDVLDRTLTVLAQDNSLTSYTYGGDTSAANGAPTNAKLEVEPPWNSNTGNGNNRLYFTDALGRLVQVNENVPSWQGGTYGQSGQAMYTTSYGYDALDDLTSVSQSGQSRSFTYDSLKRLVKAVNPESGTIKYSYDQSNNLSTRFDARQITTTLSPYDGLNRVTGKAYSDNITAPVDYCYDGSTQGLCSTFTTGGSNLLGRLTQVTAAATTNTPALIYNYLSYDWAGRPLSGSQITAGTTYSMPSYVYDLAGKMTFFQFPSGRQQSISYDSAARPSVLSGTSQATPTTYASSFGWFPNGALENDSLGSTMMEQFCQNSRLQITGVRLGAASSGSYCQSGQGTTGNSGDALVLDFTYGQAGSNGQPGANNGNLTAENIATSQSAMNNLPLNVAQSFTYDAYNRLSTAAEGSGWSQNYGYDAFGNRWVSANSGYTLLGFTPTGTPTASSYFNSNNQLIFPASTGISYLYDASGNQLTIGGSGYTYDAESRQITSTVGAGSQR